MKKFILAIGCLFLSGCGAEMFLAPIAGIVQGVIVWKDGEAKKYYSADKDVIYRATKKALEDMKLPIKKEDNDANTYSISAGENDKFSITINEEENDITRLKIRVNFMGDKPYAELLYNKIDSNLNTIRFDANGNPVKSNK